MRLPVKPELIASTTLAVILLLCGLDVWLVAGRPLARVTTVSLDRGEVTSAVSAYGRESPAPEVVLLGSSLVTAPVMQAEAKAHARPVPRFIDRRSSVLEGDLAKLMGNRPRVFCLAVGGEMASDAYLLTKHMLKKASLPAAIVYGVAPRDFQDNLFPSVEASETFQALAGLDDLPPFLGDPALTIEHKSSLVCSRLWALWRYRSDIRAYLGLRAKKLMEKVLPFVVFEKYDGNLVLRPTRIGQFPEEAKGTLMAFPNIPLEHNSKEHERSVYLKRYNPENQSLVATEFDYCRRLLKLCQDKGVSVAIVNMPLPDENIELMPPGFYKRYKENLRGLCRLYDADFVDMQSAALSDARNYVDGVHLTPEASPGFLSALAQAIYNSRASLAISRSQGALAESHNHSL